MSIELHCPKCTKLIRAPDGAGGKHGKCPYCGESVYIPMPEGAGEEIGLAPIDEEEEHRAAQLRRESTHFAASLGRATDDPAGSDDQPPPVPSGAGPPPGEVLDLDAEIETFITAMRDSKLDKADQAAARLKQTGTRARDYVHGLINDDMPPQIESVPPPLAQGFLKTLLNRLS